MKNYTVKEIAELLEVSKPTVQRAINKLSIEVSVVEKNKYRYYAFEDVKAIIEAIRPDFDFAVFDTPHQSCETPQERVETPQQNTAKPQHHTDTPMHETRNDIETINKMLEMLQSELERKNEELAKKDEKIDSLENKLHEAYLQIADFGQKAQYITAVDKTNQYLENKTVDENVINPEEPEIKKKGFFKKLFGK